MDANETALERAGESDGGEDSGNGVTWLKDFFEVISTVVILIVVFRLVFGSLTLVPLVVVTSGSMLHVNDGWDKWLGEKFEDDSVIPSFPFQSGFARGDMIITISPDKYHLFPDTRLGDVIIFDRDLAHIRRYSSNEPIIHRVVGVVWVEDDKVVRFEGTLGCLETKNISKYPGFIKSCRKGGDCVYPRYPSSSSYRFYLTKGDNNPSMDQCGASGGIAYPVNQEQLKARGWIRLPYIGWIKLIFNWILEIVFWLLKFVFSFLPL